MYVDNSAEMHGLFSSIGKAVSKVAKAPLKVATKVASKVLPDKLEKVVLAPATLATRMTTKSITTTSKLADRVVSPIARGVKNNPALIQAAGAVTTLVPGGQAAGAALMTAGRLRQQRMDQKAAEAEAARAKAEFDKAQIDALKTSAGPQIITVPGGSGGGQTVAPANNTALYVGAAAAALFAMFALTNRPRR